MSVSRDDWFEAERLHRAAAEGDLPEIQRLVAAGYDVNGFDADLSRTPLHYSVEGEQYKAAQWLIEAGANVNAHEEEKIGETPLSLAAQGNYPEIVELLLRNGADPDISGWMGLTARIRAQRRTDEEGKKISLLLEQFKPARQNPGKAR
jgi:ankyrin repeat protein